MNEKELLNFKTKVSQMSKADLQKLKSELETKLTKLIMESDVVEQFRIVTEALNE